MHFITKKMQALWNSIRYVLVVFKAKVSLWAVYRLKLVIWIISGILEPIIWSVLWYMTSQSSSTLQMSGKQILNYYLFAALMGRLTRSWTFDTIRKQIRIGKYSKYLLWPKSIILFRLGADWANRIITVSALLPFWVIWLLILKGNNLFEFRVENFTIFVLCTLSAILIRFLLDMMLGHLALFWKKMDGISQIYWSAYRLFGGVTVPLQILPDWTFHAIKFLPFRYIVSFPIEVFQGALNMQEIREGLIISGGWIVVAIIMLLIIFKYGLRKYEAVGI
jgi:ABC-2 type transport system permease protein